MFKNQNSGHPLEGHRQHPDIVPLTHVSLMTPMGEDEKITASHDICAFKHSRTRLLGVVFGQSCQVGNRFSI